MEFFVTILVMLFCIILSNILYKKIPIISVPHFRAKRPEIDMSEVSRAKARTTEAAIKAIKSQITPRKSGWATKGSDALQKKRTWS